MSRPNRRFQFAEVLSRHAAAPLIARSKPVGYCCVRSMCVGFVAWARRELGYAERRRTLRNDESVAYYRVDQNDRSCYLVVRGDQVYVWAGPKLENSGCFPKGHDTWNKGKRGWYAVGCEKTWFRKGTLRGQSARKYRPVGSVSIRAERNGTKSRYIKVRDDGPPSRRFVSLAAYIWEQKHGPVPKGSVVVHADGNSLGDRQDNLICLTRGEHIERLKRVQPKRFELALRKARRKLKARWAERRMVEKCLAENLPAVREQVRERMTA